MDENLDMDWTGLLVLLLSLSGSMCAVVQWTELDEAKVRSHPSERTFTLCNVYNDLRGSQYRTVLFK